MVAQVRVAAQVWGAGCKAAAKRIGWRCSRFGWRRRLGWLAVAAQAGLAAQVGVVGRRTLGIKPICAGCASCVCSALDIGPGQQQKGRGTLSHLPGDSIRSGSRACLSAARAGTQYSLQCTRLEPVVVHRDHRAQGVRG